MRNVKYKFAFKTTKTEQTKAAFILLKCCTLNNIIFTKKYASFHTRLDWH